MSLKGLCSIFFWLAFIPLGQGFELVKVLKVSTSGRSIIIDKGKLEGVALGDWARFIFQSGNPENPKLSDVAVAEAISVVDDQSYWIIHERSASANAYEQLKGGGHLLFAKANDILNGRRPFKTLAKTSYTSTENLQQVNELEKEDETVHGPGIIKHDKDYEVLDSLKEPVDISEHDLERTEFRPATLKQNKKGELDEKYIEAVGTELNEIAVEEVMPETAKQKEMAKKRVFHSTESGVIKKINAQKHGLAEMYNDARHDPNARIFSDHSVEKSVFEQHQYDNQQKKMISPQVYKKIKMGGPLWSADLTDSGLRRYFIQSGLESEFQRQKRALENKESHEILIRFSQGMVDNTNANDGNYRAMYKGLGLGYEFHLMKVKDTLERWSIELGYESASGFYDIGNQNAKGSETTWKGMLNYYFYNLPSAIQTFTWYLGTGIATGNAKINSVNLSQSYDYQILSLKYAQLGMKYRFYAGDEKDDAFNYGVGFNFLLSLESSTYKNSEALSDNINGTFSTNDLKFIVGASVLF